MELNTFTITDRRGTIVPGAKVTFFQAGTNTPAALFGEDGKTVGNPVTSDDNGLVIVAAANGRYDVTATARDGTVALAPRQVQFFDISDASEGPPGPKGDSAYEVWLSEGNSGSETDFLASLEGPKGDDGDEGPPGPPGDDGTSVTILGTVADEGSLPSSGNTEGDGYLIDGDLYV